MRKAIIILFVSFLFIELNIFGQELPELNKDVVDFVDQKPQPVSKSQEDRLALTGEKQIVSIAHDSRGYPKVQFILPLDVFVSNKSKSQDNQKYRPKCLRPLAFDFMIGEIRCVKGTYSKKEVMIKHVDQICYRDPQFETIKATESLRLPDCKNSELLVHRYQPELRIDTESR